MTWITRRVLYLGREDWGADPAVTRLGGPEVGQALVPGDRRVHAIYHHTVVIDDSDRSPNVWEDLEWVKIKMWRLQKIRPDLGYDVPYNFVAFLQPSGALAICEGRGYARSGAHTAGEDGQSPRPYNYFNVSGIATAFQGDFENYAIDLDPWVRAIQDWNWHLKRTFPNLGSMTVCGNSICGHKDYSRFSGLNATACPGQHLYTMLPQITLTPPEEEEDDMAEKAELVQERGSPYIFIRFGNTLSYLRDFKHADAMGISRAVRIVPQGMLQSYARLDWLDVHLLALSARVEEIKRKVFMLG